MTNERARALRARLAPEDGNRVERIEWFETLGSTNDHLLAEPPPAPSRLAVAIADEQTRGRGRGDNRWLSAPGDGLWMSLSYAFPAVPAALNTLTLALGVGVAEALRGLGVDGVMLKWPNDLILDDGKLGGILVESRTQRGGAVAICGIGINLREPPAVELADGALPAVGLRHTGRAPEIDELAAGILAASLATFERFAALGFASFVDDWSARDWLRGRRVAVSEPPVAGVADGIDAEGRLAVRAPDALHHVTSGTVRPILDG